VRNGFLRTADGKSTRHDNYSCLRIASGASIGAGDSAILKIVSFGECCANPKSAGGARSGCVGADEMRFGAHNLRLKLASGATFETLEFCILELETSAKPK
jgi:hypothetical protein